MEAQQGGRKLAQANAQNNIALKAASKASAIYCPLSTETSPPLLAYNQSAYYTDDSDDVIMSL